MSLMKYYSYENFAKDTNSLIKQVNDYNPHAMAEGLNVHNVQTLRTELFSFLWSPQECIQ